MKQAKEFSNFKSWPLVKILIKVDISSLQIKTDDIEFVKSLRCAVLKFNHYDIQGKMKQSLHFMTKCYFKWYQ